MTLCGSHLEMPGCIFVIRRNPPTVLHAPSEMEHRTGMSLLGGQYKIPYSNTIVFFASNSHLMRLAQVISTIGIIGRRTPPEVSNASDYILLHAASLHQTLAIVILPITVMLLGCSPKELRCPLEVPLSAFSPKIAHAEFKLPARMLLIGGLLKKFGGGFDTFFHELPLTPIESKLPLSARVSFVGGCLEV
jgi:hypothetical protein